MGRRLFYNMEVNVCADIHMMEIFPCWDLSDGGLLERSRKYMRYLLFPSLSDPGWEGSPKCWRVGGVGEEFQELLPAVR